MLHGIPNGLVRVANVFFAQACPQATATHIPERQSLDGLRLVPSDKGSKTTRSRRNKQKWKWTAPKCCAFDVSAFAFTFMSTWKPQKSPGLWDRNPEDGFRFKGEKWDQLRPRASFCECQVETQIQGQLATYYTYLSTCGWSRGWHAAKLCSSHRFSLKLCADLKPRLHWQVTVLFGRNSRSNFRSMVSRFLRILVLAFGKILTHVFTFFGKTISIYIYYISFC